jgi:dienelactone hydrolase
MDAAAPWVRGGAAIASIDFPLHGARHSAKLSERFVDSVGHASSLNDLDQLLWTEFARQAVLDLRRCLDALAPLAQIDSQRIAYAGFSLGAMAGAVFCAEDPRPRAAALALGGGGLGPAAVDPCSWVERIAPRPLLFVGAEHDEVIPRAATEALYEAAREPKSLHWYEAPHSSLPGEALKKMWLFLKDHLAMG